MKTTFYTPDEELLNKNAELKITKHSKDTTAESEAKIYKTI